MGPAGDRFDHPQISRRTAVQAGAIGLLGLGMNHVTALRALAGPNQLTARAKSVIYIFLSGGLAQHESFDLKPEAKDSIRGEFQPIDTQTAGIQICEHLPMLAARSNHWALVRSLTHPYNDHSVGHMVMLSGRTPLPPGFSGGGPRPGNWPSMVSLATALMRPANNLPPAVVLPEKLIHRTGRVIPGQFAGRMGKQYDPWFVEATNFNALSYGAYPDYDFHHEKGLVENSEQLFQAPSLKLPDGLTRRRVSDRLQLVSQLTAQRRHLEAAADVQDFDRHRQSAISLLTGAQAQFALDVENVDSKTQDAYGRNTFGRSLLVARRLVERGVSLVQVNLGNNETWDTHQSAFPNLKKFLLPPMDRAVSALLDDLHDRGLLDETLIVMAGEFGRTPNITALDGGKLPGRNHWGAVQSVFLAGGGVRGGTVVGSSDPDGGYPASDPQTPENLAATIYSALGLPATTAWYDKLNRPHLIYHGEPIGGLT